MYPFAISFFFFKQKTAYEIGLGIPAEPLFRSCRPIMSIDVVEVVIWRESSVSGGSGAVQMFLRWQQRKPDRKSGSAGMPRPISYAVFCLKKKMIYDNASHISHMQTIPQEYTS